MILRYEDPDLLVAYEAEVFEDASDAVIDEAAVELIRDAHRRDPRGDDTLAASSERIRAERLDLVTRG